MTTVDEILQHHGVKGMKWGVRKDRGLSTASPAHPPHEDALNAKAFRAKAKASGTDSLSNAELKKTIERMNLEQQYSRLSAPQKSAGKQFVTELLKNVGKQQALRLVNDTVAKQVGKALG